MIPLFFSLSGTMGTITSNYAVGFDLTSGHMILVPVAASSSGGLASSNFIFDETPSGTVNGINATFTLANTPVTGTVMLYINGLRQEYGSNINFTVSGATITMVNRVPLTGDRISADYIK